MQPLQQLQRAGDRPQVLDVRRRVAREHVGNAMRMKRVPLEALLGLAAEAVGPVEQVLVCDREERAAQRREHRQLVVRPLDRGERRADRFDLFALVERASADEHVRDAARLERLDVGPGDIGLPADEAAEEQADVLGRDGDRRCARCARSPSIRSELTIQSTIAPTAAGSDLSIATPET